VTARDVIQVLETDGWRQVRSRGSHRQFKHPTKPGLVTVAVHSARDLKLRDLVAIERTSGVKLRKD
jgi:predicted RNA binding protein YcfA (HicA-like mRNA interferase family)